MASSTSLMWLPSSVFAVTFSCNPLPAKKDLGVPPLALASSIFGCNSSVFAGRNTVDRFFAISRAAPQARSKSLIPLLYIFDTTICERANFLNYLGAVTIVTDNAESEILYPNPGNCQQLKHIHRNGMASVNLHQGFCEDLKNIKQKLGISNEQKVDFILLLDNIFAEQAHDLPSYPVLKNSMQLIEQRAVDSFFYITKNNTREILQMSVGPLLNAIEDNIKKAIESPSSDIKTRKLILYAVHDVTLFPLLMAMGVFNSKWPPYAADVTLELYQHSKDWFIRLIYNGEELIPRGCKDGLCPLEDFLNALSVYSTKPLVYKMICSQTEEAVLQHN